MAQGGAASRAVPQTAIFWRIAVFELALAALLLVAPPLFASPIYSVVRADLLPLVAVCLVAGGAALAAVAGILPRRALAPTCATAALPPALLAYNFAVNATVSGAIAYTIEAGTLLFTAVCLWRDVQLRVRLYVLMTGATVLALGLSMLLVPQAYADVRIYDGLAASLWIAAPMFVFGGAGLIAAEVRTRSGIAGRRVLLAFASIAAVDLAVLLNVFAATGTWTGVVSYGLMAVILLLAVPRTSAPRESPVLFASLAAVAALGDVIATIVASVGGPEISPSWAVMRPLTGVALLSVGSGFAIVLLHPTRSRRVTVALGIVGLCAAISGALVAFANGRDAPQVLLGRLPGAPSTGTVSGPLAVAAAAVILIAFAWRPWSRIAPLAFVVFGAGLFGLVALSSLAYMIGSPFLLDVLGIAAMRLHTAIALGILAIALLTAGSVRLLAASITDRFVGAMAALSVLVLLRGYLADAALAHVFVDVDDIGQPSFLAAVEEARTLSLLLLVALATATTLLLVRTVTMPLHEVMAAIARARAGENRARAEVEGDDEIGVMARSFNNLTRELADQSDLYSAVRRAQSDLGEAIIVLRAGEPLQWNEALSKITGYADADMRGMRSILDLWPNSTRADIADLLRERCTRTYRFETALVGRDGTMVVVELALTPLRDRPDEQLAIMRDITERTQAQRSLERLALRDPLTDLPNRTLFADRLSRTIAAAKRANDTFTLVYLDIDRFKEVNDGYGHDTGDALLREIARRLTSPLSAADTLARFGGDEFAVLLPRTHDVSAAVLVAELLRTALRSPFEIEQRTIFAEASFGVVAYPADGADAETLLRRADIAMYHAKRAGKGIAAYAREVDPQNDKRVALMSDLRHAIERGQLELHYQPQVRLMDRRVGSVEALIRWRHPERGMVAPMDFIPLAEESGFINELAVWVAHEAPRQITSLASDGLEPRVAINLSMRNLHHPQLVETIAAELRSSGLHASALTVEVTETAAMADAQRSVETLGRIADLGVRVSVDDFGTGYSSLGHLRRMPVRELKIDKTFVFDMLTNPSSEAIVASTINLGHSLGLTVVAEGVEDQATLEALARRGCDVAQGYHIARPMPFDQLRAWLRESQPVYAAAAD